MEIAYSFDCVFSSDVDPVLAKNRVQGFVP